jgi:folate-binding protein YgfZ
MSDLQGDVTISSSPFATLPGAVLPEQAGEVSGPAVPVHYGDPFREQRELEEGRAVVDASDLGILSLTGDDRRRLLHALTSQDLADIAPGASAETLILDPQGRIEYAARVLDDGHTSWLIVDPGLAEPLAAFFDRMRFMLRVDVAVRSGDLAVVASAGDIAGIPIASPSGVPLVWRDPWSGVVAGGWQYAEGAHPGADRTWFESIVERVRLPEVVELVRSGALAVAGSLAAEALRIAAWRPRQALDADDRTIPHELDWLRTAVHLEKGCYRGQETVAKVHNLGRPPRRVVMLHLDGSDAVLPAHGAEITAVKDGVEREVGRVTSSAIHHDLGPIALAVVKRAVPIDTPLSIRVGDDVVAAAQQAIVPPGAGATADVPRLPRLGRG